MQDVLWFYTENHTKNGYSLVKYIQIDSNTINRVKRPPISAIITKNKSPVVKLPHYSSHNPWDIIFMKTETTLCEISNSRRYVGTRGIMPLGGQFRFWAKKKKEATNVWGIKLQAANIDQLDPNKTEFVSRCRFR